MSSTLVSELRVSADLNELSSVLTVQFEELVVELRRGKVGTMDNFRTA
jgi:hypothetical protein